MIERFLHNAQKKPARMIALSFFAVILVGSFLLSLPIATANGIAAGWTTALFTAVSATCVTGLVVADTALFWSLFGQIVILCLIQIGGLGLVTLTTFFFTLLKRRIGIQTLAAAQQSSASFTFAEVRDLIKKIVALTFAFEAFGAIIFMWRMIPRLGWSDGIYRGIFHAVSSFCNAGFDLMGSIFGPYSSLSAWGDDPIVILTTAFLIISGGLGFIVWADILNINKEKGLNFHSRLVLKLTFFFLLVGTVFFLFAERNNTSPEALGTMSFFKQLQSSFFQSVTARTAGFNIIPQQSLNESSKIFSGILMFIGASSGSTGGGIKITTFSMILFFIVSEIRGQAEITFFKRKISRETANRSIVIIVLSMAIIVLGTVLLSVIERNALRVGSFSLLDLCFECISAFGTVGLSSVGTPALREASHILLIFIMFVGRIGPASFAIAIAGRSDLAKEKILPEVKVVVG
jgi:trk system potassium uptake protein